MVGIKWLKILCLVGILWNCQSKHSDHQNDRNSPNIILVLADDLGWSQIGCYGSDYYQTPNIDQLAREGMKFTNAYAAAAVCSPTRASIMTGKYPAKLHLTDFIAGNTNTDYPLLQPDWQKHLPLSEKTIAELLKEAGYKTAHFGKWHLSQDKMPPESLPYNPDKQGFDETFVTYKPSQNMAQAWQQPEIDAHNVDTITHLALDFLRRNKDSTFFLMVSHNTIHDPLMEKEALITKYDTLTASDKPENHPVIAAMIETLDKSTGEIMEAVETLGLKENTVFLFFSDNGGKESYASQTPLRKGKGWLYEGGIRVPLLIRWPGMIQPGRIFEEMVCSIDLLPSFAEIAGLDINDQQVNGISILPVLTSTQDIDRNTLYWHYPHYHRGSGMKPASAIRRGDYKLIEWHEPTLLEQGQAIELYNLAEDIGEEKNLAGEMPEKARELREELNRWRENVTAQMPTVNNNLP